MKNKYKIWAWTPLIIMLYVIFNFSAAGGEQSSNLTLTLTHKIVNVFTDIKRFLYNSSQIATQENLLSDAMLHTTIRKLGHFTEYTLFGLAIAFPLYLQQISKWKLVICSISIGFLYACSDELHQLFVEGRSGQFTDVLIDSFGVIFGLIIFLVIVEIYNRRKDVVVVVRNQP
jgi:VanZ family protein